MLSYMKQVLIDTGHVLPNGTVVYVNTSVRTELDPDYFSLYWGSDIQHVIDYLAEFLCSTIPKLKHDHDEVLDYLMSSVLALNKLCLYPLGATSAVNQLLTSKW